MNESQIRNMTPDELLSAFECGQLTDDNVKQAFGRVCTMLEDAIDEKESAEEECCKLQDEASELEDRVNELEDIIDAALECDELEDMIEELNKA
tara:strand:- start:345 stop:626 length:282 start_codon:yes stop_codon:yes gene_type:complete